MDTAVADRPAYAANMAPVKTETPLTGPLPVTGRVPQGLSGTLLRNGPNPYRQAEGQHWFGGDGMLHAFDFDKGQVRYRNLWVPTQRYLSQKAGDAWAGGKLQLVTGDTGAANTNILVHAGRLLALEEAHLPMQLGSRDLASAQVQDFAGRVSGSFTAHPKIDPKSGEMVFFGYGNPDWLSARMAYGTINAAGEVTSFEHFEAPYASMLHDFAVSERHVIFPVMPVVASLDRAKAGRPPFAWEPDRQTQVGLMRRGADVSTIRWFTVPSCYVYHTMNAWDDENHVYVDVMQAEAAAMFPKADGSKVEGAGGARLCRWTFDLRSDATTFTQEWLCDISGEFPRMDDRFAGSENRHGWFVGDSDGRLFSRIVHIDHEEGRLDTYSLPSSDCASEAIFVPHTPDAAEGEGWLLTVVYRGDLETSELLIFDASNVAAGPVATARLPVRVPNGFHGSWIDASATINGFEGN